MARAIAAKRRREWIESVGAKAAHGPMWSSRERWLSDLRAWSASASFAADASAARVSIAASTLVAIAAVMAVHADHATGRHVAVTRATVAVGAGCSPDTVTAAWRLLRSAGWAVEAQRGHGSPGTPAAGRRPSVYHLVPRRESRPVAALMPFAKRQYRAGLVDNPDLPPKAGFGCLSPVGTDLPSAHAHPEQSAKNTHARRRYRAAPRPLSVQRLAAALVARCHGLHRGHIGGICDAITAAGIDPTVWSARAITDALNTDMKTHGWSWPDRIERPGAFLASRLQRLDWQPNEPQKSGGYAATSREEEPAAVLEPSIPLTPQQRQRIAAAKADIRATIVAAQTRRSTAAQDSSRLPHSEDASEMIAAARKEALNEFVGRRLILGPDEIVYAESEDRDFG